MSDNIPLQIQHEIIKWFPLKSLLQFRSVCKPWKSIIDSSKFINEYQIIHKRPQRLLLQYEVGFKLNFRSYIDDDTFPRKKGSLVRVPECIKRLRNPFRVISWSNGLFCLLGYFPDIGLDTQRVVLWNPFVRKTVQIDIPRASNQNVSAISLLNFLNLRSGASVVGFGVSPTDSNDVKLLMVNSSIPTHWVVKVFTLSSRAWRNVSCDPPFKSCDLSCDQVSVNGYIYFHGYDDFMLTGGVRSNLIASFDLKSEMFGQVRLPDIILHSEDLGLSKLNECLAVVEYSHNRDIGVWMIKDATTEAFTKIFTVKSRDPLMNMKSCLLGFRKNGQAIIQTTDYVNAADDDDDGGSSRLKVYDPSSGRINDTGIRGIEFPYSVSSYTETLLLLDQSNSTIH